jgi:HD domain
LVGYQLDEVGMMRRSIGTNAWAALGGRLRRQDRMRLMGQAMLTRLAAMSGRLQRSAGFESARFRHVDLQAIRLPDSRVAVKASELASELCEPWLYNHSMRTYLWGAMLAQVNDIKIDEELFFTASVLHDLGLTSTHLCQDTSCSCFAVEGARAARQFASQEGWSNQRCDQLAEAISLHLNVRVGLHHGAEAHLLHAGTSLDIIGARARQLDANAVNHVLDAYPKLSLKANMVEAMKDQSRTRPESRAAFLVGLGFIGMLRAAP